ncbi:MAG: ParA family protein [Bacteroidetes bacterium]|nr:ParA family protein [Bacteroidota bacterium]
MATGDGRENRLKNFLNQEQIANNFDIIVIDTPPTPSIWMTSALIASDYYLIPVKPDPISFTGIDLLRGIINYKKENYSLKIECLGVVLTMTEDNLVYRQAISFLNSSTYWKPLKFNGEILKRTAVAREQLQGVFILDLADEVNKINLTKITGEILKKI